MKQFVVKEYQYLNKVTASSKDLYTDGKEKGVELKVVENGFANAKIPVSRILTRSQAERLRDWLNDWLKQN